MTLANDPDLAAIEEAIVAAELPPEPGVLVGYLILTEWMSADGETYLIESAPDSQAYWKALGYVDATRASMYARVHAAQEEQDDEDDDV